jgi:hypothetical protein
VTAPDAIASRLILAWVCGQDQREAVARAQPVEIAHEVNDTALLVRVAAVSLVVRIEDNDVGSMLADDALEFVAVLDIGVEREPVRGSDIQHVIAIRDSCLPERALDRPYSLLEVDDKNAGNTRAEVPEHLPAGQSGGCELQRECRLAVPGIGDDDRSRPPDEEWADEHVRCVRLGELNDLACGANLEREQLGLVEFKAAVVAVCSPLVADDFALSAFRTAAVHAASCARRYCARDNSARPSRHSTVVSIARRR